MLLPLFLRRKYRRIREKNKEEEEERQVLEMRCERKRGPESKMKRTIRRSG